MNEIGDKIRETRKLKGLTQDELAEKASLNLRTIQRIENSENEPRGKTLSLICDVLEIDLEDFMVDTNSTKTKSVFTKIVQGIFLAVFNIILMGIIGFLTLDSEANTNSLFGGVIVSILIPLFIVNFTHTMSSNERVLKFGFGYVVYLLAAVVVLGLPIGFTTGLIPCLLISLFFLYFGNDIIKTKLKMEIN
jgi:transcriptional regulator with XRE-family HTH domain